MTPEEQLAAQAVIRAETVHRMALDFYGDSEESALDSRLAVLHDALNQEALFDPECCPQHRQLIAAADPLLADGWPGLTRFIDLVADLRPPMDPVAMSQVVGLLLPVPQGRLDRMQAVAIATIGMLHYVLFGATASSEDGRLQRSGAPRTNPIVHEEALDEDGNLELESTMEDELDRAHLGLLHELLGHDNWRRPDLVAVCRAWRLLPDGAVDVINEASLHLCGMPLFRNSDPLVLNQSAWNELKP